MDDKIDLRIRKTYLSLHSAFTALLEERRFEDFTVNELCDRAMIRRATFYKHFADKYEYFEFYLKEVCAAFSEQLSSDVRLYSVNSYSLHMCRELLRFIKQHEMMVKNVLHSNMFPLLLSILLEQIQRDTFQVWRAITPPGNMSIPEMEGMAAFFAGGVLSTLFHYLKHGTPIDEELFVRIVSQYFPTE